MPTITDEQREKSRIYKESAPASVCVCGHTGDGIGSAHLDTAFAPGHAECTVPGCACLRFRWDRFRIPYMEKVGIRP